MVETEKHHGERSTELETIALLEEHLDVRKVSRVTGRVRVSSVTQTVEEHVRETLADRKVEIVRVPIDRVVSEAPGIRVEGDVTIMPVLEEIVVVEKRLVLKEELHIRQVSTQTTVDIPVTLRRQRADIERLGADPIQHEEVEDPMAYDETSRTGRETITAFFDSRTEAQNAMDRLRNEGLSTAEVRLIEGSENVAGRTDTYEHKGFWASLGDLFMPDEDRGTYAEGLSRGGYVVSVQASPANRETVLDILDDEGTVNLDERVASWRSEGWSGYAGADRDDYATHGDDVGLRSGIAGIGGTSDLGGAYATDASSTRGTDRSYETTARDSASLDATGLAGTGLGRTGTRDDGSDLETRSSGAALDQNDRYLGDRDLGSSRDFASRDLGDTDKIDVVAEELRVGKRDISHGRVRVRSYVVEEPVTENVNLRSERVDIERRPVDRAVSGADALFQDRTIEAEERAEEAVVSKEARVKEEISLNRDVSDRTETVSDTVRRTEVEIDDERTAAERRAGLTGTTGRADRDL